MFKKPIKTLLFLLVMFTISVVNAQDIKRADISGRHVHIKIYFPYDQDYIDSTYMGNGDNLRQIDSLLRDTSFVSTLSKIELTAQSSPEGTVRYNSRLSELRRLSIEKYFTAHYPEIDVNLWSFKAVAENWELFHENLLNDSELPQREKVLSISSSYKELDQKEWLLKTMDEGKPWQYIKKNILPSQRFGAGVVFIPKTPEPIVYSPLLQPRLSVPQIDLVPSTTKSITESKLLFAVKTNLIYDLASALNLEVEVPIGEKFSVTGEVINPWWYSASTNFTMRAHMFTIGGKYWFDSRAPKDALTGLAVGINAGYSNKYDVQLFSEHGIQGTYLMAGATVSYAHRLYKNLRMEYQLGLGATISDYKNYTMAYDTEHGDIKVFDYPWIVKRKTIVGPTQLRVSLSYLIFKTKTIER